MSDSSDFFGGAGGAVARGVWDAAKPAAFVMHHDDVISPLRAHSHPMLDRGGYAGYVGGLYVLSRVNSLSSGIGYSTTASLLSGTTGRPFPAFMGTGAYYPAVGASEPGGAHMVVVASDQSAYNRMARTTDGISWTQIIAADVGSASAAIMLKHDGVSEYVLSYNNGKLWTSTDGVTWTQRTGALSLFYYGMVRVGSRRFFATSSGVYSSDDMTTFTVRHALPNARALAIGVCGTRIVALYAPTQYGAQGSEFTSFCTYYYSDDSGVTWTKGAEWQCANIADGHTHRGGARLRNAPLNVLYGVEYAASSQSANAHGALVVKGASTVASTYDSSYVPTQLDNVLIVTFDGVTMYPYKTGSFDNSAGMYYGGHVSVLGTQLIVADAQSYTCSINVDAKEIAIER